MSLLPYLHRVAAREDLPAEDARQAMEAILEAQATTGQIAAFLVALKMKGETAHELYGFAAAMRRHSEKVECGPLSEPLIDTCGTGGAPVPTFNISTVVAFVTAGAGVRVAKHGNRSLSGVCGSADVLEALGVKIQMSAARMAQAITETGIGFLFAPALHPAMKHAQPARAELKMRTIFNLLGPLTNPAGAAYQLIGAPSEHSADLIAHALASLGTHHSFVVHGLDGLDEVSTTGPTLVYEVKGSAVRKHLWTPGDFGIKRASLHDLTGGDPLTNAAIARAILEGEPGPHRDVVLVNASAALVAAGKAPDLRAGVQLAANSIDTGGAAGRLAQLIRFSAQEALQAAP